MNFWEHIEALRRVLLQVALLLFGSTLLLFCFHRALFHFILTPLGTPLYLFGPLEGFHAALKLSFSLAVVLTSPFSCLLLLRFFLPALKRREKRIVLPFLLLSTLFITAGILFGYFLTLPLVMAFFLTFNQEIGANLWSMSHTLNLALTLIFAHAVAFELIAALLLSVHLRVITAAQLVRSRRLIYLLILILAAILTPPDIVSQLLLALPLGLFFEGTLLYAHFLNKRLLNT